ncbi:MAG: GIY-YIG nuclease family protein [Crocinitomicaceae bacterium]|nr:GIY-YIG nuclease family protein [Crocinitomicaceae bacterium]
MASCSTRLSRHAGGVKVAGSIEKVEILEVYILYSEVILKHYVGHTQNVEERLAYHNSGYSKYTKSGIPWKLVWSQECTDRSEAMKLEKKIKKRGAKRFLIDLGV